MSKAVLMSVHPKLCANILNEKKTLVLQKSQPKLETPFKCYIYCTQKGRPLVYGSPVAYYVDESYVQTWGWGKDDADRIFGNLQGKIIAEFVCRQIDKVDVSKGSFDDLLLKKTCMEAHEIIEYSPFKPVYAWHISDLVNYDIYDEPRELSALNVRQAPQGWCYVEDDIRVER